MEKHDGMWECGKLETNDEPPPLALAFREPFEFFIWEDGGAQAAALRAARAVLLRPLRARGRRGAESIAPAGWASASWPTTATIRLRWTSSPSSSASSRGQGPIGQTPSQT